MNVFLLNNSRIKRAAMDVLQGLRQEKERYYKCITLGGKYYKRMSLLQNYRYFIAKPRNVNTDLHAN